MMTVVRKNTRFACTCLMEKTPARVTEGGGNRPAWYFQVATNGSIRQCGVQESLESAVDLLCYELKQTIMKELKA
jgi:hypothetical protein